MACPLLDDVVNEEVLILRRAFRHERDFRDRADPLAFSDEYLTERYRFSGDASDICEGCWVQTYSTGQHGAMLSLSHRWSA